MNPPRIAWHTDHNPATGERHTLPTPWPDDWPLPRVGDGIYTRDGTPLQVTAVAWFPYGEPGEDDDDPFIYVVTHRPGFRS